MARNWNKVFGIGLSKTGTSSLAAALRRLGLKVSDFPYDAQTQAQLECGDYKLNVLEQHDALTDTPAAYCFAQLDEAFPGSLFILTERADRQRWLESLRIQWQHGDEWAKHHSQFGRFSYFIRCATYGITKYSANRLIYAYERHSCSVRRHFIERPDDLLVHDVSAGAGWEELCSFLNMPVPKEPYPRVNAREEKAAQAEFMSRLNRLYSDVEIHTSADEELILVDGEELSGSQLRSVRTCIPLIHRRGAYDGQPKDSRHAIEFTESHVSLGRSCLVVFYTSFWWYDVYPEWANYVDDRFARCYADEACRIHRLY